MLMAARGVHAAAAARGRAQRGQHRPHTRSFTHNLPTLLWLSVAAEFLRRDFVLPGACLFELFI